MKILIFLVLIVLNCTAYANNTLLVQEKITSAAYALNNILSDVDYVNLSSLQCKEKECNSKIIFNDIEIGNIYFNGEFNNLNGVSMVDIKILNNDQENDLVFLKYICLPDNICRFFLFEQFDAANYAYENNRFHF